MIINNEIGSNVLCEVRITFELGAYRKSVTRGEVSTMTYLAMFKGGLHGAHSGKDNPGGGCQV